MYNFPQNYKDSYDSIKTNRTMFELKEENDYLLFLENYKKIKSNGNPNILKKFMDGIASPINANYLERAIADKNKELIKDLINFNTVPIINNSNGENPIITACKNNDIELLEILTNAKLFKEQPKPCYGENTIQVALLIAYLNDNKEIINILKTKCDANLINLNLANLENGMFEYLFNLSVKK